MRLVLGAACAFVLTCPCQAALPPGALARIESPGRAVWVDVRGVAVSPDGRALASGSLNGTTMVWDVAGPAGSLPPADPGVLWEQLADGDVGVAFRAVWRLADDPDQSLPLLRRHLQPAMPLPAARLAGWIRDLDDNDFAVREQASRELEKASDLAEAALRKATEETPSLEVRRRAGRLLKPLEAGPSRETVRVIRAIEVLQHAGTAEARELLESLARGMPEAPITREARAALACLKGRRKAP